MKDARWIEIESDGSREATGRIRIARDRSFPVMVGEGRPSTSFFGRWKQKNVDGRPSPTMTTGEGSFARRDGAAFRLPGRARLPPVK